jgi:GNAT superfamily N-acetyltransferase
MGMGKFVKVRLGGKDYHLPHYDEHDGKLIRITSHPLNPDRLLVWRKSSMRFALVDEYNIVLREATKRGDEILEGMDVANLGCRVFPAEKRAWVWDFFVHPDFREQRLGTALRETLLQRLKEERIKEVSFPLHKEQAFYLKRGFNAKDVSLPGQYIRGLYPTTLKSDLSSLRYAGGVKDLGVKPKDIYMRKGKEIQPKDADYLKILWQRAHPRYK